MLKELCALALAQLREAKQPVIFFDDDVDGLCSALLIARTFNKGFYYSLKPSSDELVTLIRGKIDEHQPDLVVFLDKAFLPAQVFQILGQRKIIWVDHHEVQQAPENVTYVNPQRVDPSDNRPTTHWVYEILERPKEQLWVAGLGIISDWQLTDVHKDFAKQYPALAAKAKSAPELMFRTPVGILLKIFLFNLHGKTTDIRKAFRMLCQIKTPEELLQHSTKESEFLYSRYQRFQKEYDILLADVKAKAQITDKHILYTYEENVSSFTAHLSNQLLFENPGKLIVIARLKNNVYKCSLRITPPHIINANLTKLFTKYPGEGGGHPQACGARIPAAVFPDVIAELEEMVFSN